MEVVRRLVYFFRLDVMGWVVVLEVVRSGRIWDFLDVGLIGFVYELYVECE